MTKKIRTYLCFLTCTLFLLVAGIAPALAVNAVAPPPAAVTEKKTATPPLPLTAKEKAWLEQHKVVRIAFDGYFPPYSFLNDNGELEGLALDVLPLLAERIGITLEISPKVVWNELYEAAQKREVDVVATMGDRPERLEWFAFTQPYIFKSLVIMTRHQNESIRKPEDLAGKRVALVESYQYVKPLLEKYPTIKPYYVDTMLDGLNTVAIGKADAVITFIGAAHFLQNKYQISTLKFAAIFERDRFNESIAVRTDWPELAAIFDKALDSISSQELQALQKKWLPAESLTQRVVLTDEERAWIKAHPVIRVGIDPEFAPFELWDKDGVYAGIAADYLQILKERTGLSFEVAPGLSWSQVIGKAQSREIDLLPCVGRTDEREQFLLYSDSYTNSQRVIITRKDTPFIGGISAIASWKVAVQADSSNEGFLKENTSIKPVRVASTQEGLKVLSGGTVEAFVCNIGSAAYWIRELKITNLKVAAPVSEGMLHMAVRKDWPLLAGIINKGLATISEAEKNRISQKWIAIEYKTGIDRITVFIYLGMAIVVMLAGASVFMLWNRTLKRQVHEKTAELAESEERFRDIFNAANDAFFIHDIETGAILDVNQKMCEMFGLSREEALHSDVGSFSSGIPPYTQKDAANWIRKATVGVPQLFEWHAKDRSGRIFWVEVNMRRSAIGPDERIIALSRDISDRKEAELELEKYRDNLEKLVAERTSDLRKTQQALQFMLEDLNSANARLLEVDRLKSMFIASMSHELRTPLNAVIGFSSILINEWVGPLNDEQKKNLTAILRSGKHLLSMINDVIDVSKIEAGMIDVGQEDFELDELLTEVEQVFASEAQKRKISLNVQQISLPMHADRRRLLQCLLNLVSNALKFTAQGGVTVTVRPNESQGSVTMVVTDTGFGIASEDQPKLFQAFSRISSPLTSTVPGTGLGLYLTKKIVEEILQGAISVKSEPGAGSSFSITLPIRQEKDMKTQG